MFPVYKAETQHCLYFSKISQNIIKTQLDKKLIQGIEIWQ